MSEIIKAESTDSLLSIADLQSRYGINRTSLYTRINTLEIEPLRLGNRSMFDREKVDMLDELHERIKAKEREGKKENWRLLVAKDEKSEKKEEQLKSELLPLFALLESVGERIESIESAINVNRAKELKVTEIDSFSVDFKDLEMLEKVYQHKWYIDSNRLAKVLGMSKGWLLRHKEVPYCGFILQRVQQKGKSAVYRVLKVES
jgi:hypothetical protein